MTEATTDETGNTEIRERFFSAHGEQIFVREAGRVGAPAILLLHDFGTTSATFEPLMKLLSDRYHLVAPDFLGFGRSSTPPVAEFECGYPYLGCNASAILTRHLGIKSYAVYAQGSAGPAALGAFYEVKEEIAAIIMQSATWSADGLERLTAETPGGQPDPDTVKILLKHHQFNSWHLEDSWRHALHSYDMDVLVLWGKRDDVMDPKMAGDIPAILPKTKVVMLEAGHDVLAERMPEVAHEIDNFLTRLKL